ncbi:pyocin knob domain-containing protein [Lysinibacillus sp. KU-BSD001]|uniref:pyocin knob domain-containing protein n=1 Tax=Lysinibacillus sp. KU-BSD001 TaxID=3141328 RepID=UPI0036EF2FF0
MAEHFSFFDPVQLPDGTYDREYNAEKFTKYFGVLVTTGVMKGVGNMLAVSANGSNMVTRIDTGIAFVEAKYYENDSFLELTHDTETLGKSRIDRIVVRMDLSTEARYVRAFIKKGVSSTSPVAPALTQTANIYEISLAQVKIVGGQTFIAANAVTDERGIDVICPWAGSNILPSFDDNALAQHINNQQIHVTEAQQNFWNDQLVTNTNVVLGGSVDFNTLDWGFTFKIYDVSGALNAPPEGYGVITTFSTKDNSWGVQKFYGMSTGNTYYRTYADGTWKPWRMSGFAQQTVVSWNSVYGRFPEYCAIITDWDLAVQNGRYMAQGASNAPNGEWFMGIVISHNAEWIVQKVIQFTGIYGEREYERWKKNGVWGPWTETSPKLLFPSVSNGKATVNQAVTDMGIYTAPDATFQTTANNIRNLSNRVSGNGIVLSSGITVSNLNFRPRIVLIKFYNGSNLNGEGIYVEGWYNVSVDVFNPYLFDNSVQRWGNYGNVFTVMSNGFSLTGGVTSSLSAVGSRYEYVCIK